MYSAASGEETDIQTEHQELIRQNDSALKSSESKENSLKKKKKM